MQWGERIAEEFIMLIALILAVVIAALLAGEVN